MIRIYPIKSQVFLRSATEKRSVNRLSVAPTEHKRIYFISEDAVRSSNSLDSADRGEDYGRALIYEPLDIRSTRGESSNSGPAYYCLVMKSQTNTHFNHERKSLESLELLELDLGLQYSAFCYAGCSDSTSLKVSIRDHLPMSLMSYNHCPAWIDSLTKKTSS